MSADRVYQLVRIGRTEQAVKLAAESLSRDPVDVRLYHAYAQALRNHGDVDGALVACEHGLALAPADVPLLVEHAAALSLSMRFDDAQRSIHAALAIDPLDFAALATAVNAISRELEGQFTNRKKRVAMAHEYARRLVQNYPEQATAHLMMAVTCMMEQDYQNTLSSAQEAVKLDPNSAGAHHLVGFANERLGNKRAASQAYVVSGKLAPESQASLDGLRRLGRPAHRWILFLALLAGAAIPARNLGLSAPEYVRFVVALAFAIAVMGGLIVGSVWLLGRIQGTALPRGSHKLSPEARRLLEQDKKFRRDDHADQDETS